ncbi:longevity assurance proteins LAG1/LAC1 [Ascodesmis nigricans]|uniref:Longevity assurance proteins LAG1/LAC1 n=1 Tax=Ascodesmis nigricans TaxID=341454 RepID=A0A4S2MH78_9PEZI|nr:longevity assurance proteins LAG1/LAC1 [Ascodesmis nigricans]
MHSSGYERLHDQRSLDASVISSGIDTFAKSRGCNGGESAPLKRRQSSTSTSQPKRRQQPNNSSTRLAPPHKPAPGLASYIVEHQLQLSLGILVTLSGIHVAVPELRPLVRKFYSVSHYNPATGLFSKGYDDGYFVAFWIIAFTFIRSFALDHIFTPLAKHGGIKSKKGIVRFTEQSWMMVYYTSSTALGAYLAYNSPYWNNLIQLWTDWPVRELGGLFKWYYLVQFAFWLQQIFVINIEERRKDHYQMLAHHFITCSLMACSYVYHMTRVGNIILIMMDFVDILLPAAKLLKYLGYHTLCDYAFGVFLLSWVVVRHLLYNRVVYSVWKDLPAAVPFGCYTSNSTAPLTLSKHDANLLAIEQSLTFKSDVTCFTDTIQWSFIYMLVFLQILTLVWLYMIMRVAYRVIVGGSAEDTRSDDEDEGENDIMIDEDHDETPTAVSTGASIGQRASRHIPSRSLGND